MTLKDPRAPGVVSGCAPPPVALHRGDAIIQRHGAYALLSLAILVALSFAHRQARAAGCKDQTPTSWDIVVAPVKEPGERLVVEGRVLNTMNQTPLPGITVYVYHADSKGDYALKGHEKEAPRLCGILRTNGKGQYRFETSMPGGYEGYLPHIHFEMWGPGLRRQYTFVNLERREVAMDTSRAGVLPAPDPARRGYNSDTTRPVYRGQGGKLHCVRDLQVAK